MSDPFNPTDYVDPRRFERLPFTSAVDYFRGKINLPSNRWDDFLDSEHDAAFVVAGAKGSLLSDLRGAVDRAIASGQRVEEFQKQFERIAEGWSHTGDKDWRSRIIYNTNLRMAYAAGRNQHQLDPEVVRLQPYRQYMHGASVRPRPSHLALDRKIFPANQVPFETPNGYGCSCRYISMSQRQVDRRGLEVSKLRRGDTVSVQIDGRTYNPVLQPEKGFDYTPGVNNRETILAAIIARSPQAIAALIKRERAKLNGEFAKKRAAKVAQPAAAEPPQKGIPVSNAFQLPNSAKAAELREALATIDSVHTDGTLEPVPFKWTQNRSLNGFYQSQGARASAIGINAQGKTQSLTLAHEIGHWLDHQAIGKAGEFASLKPSQIPAMRQWALAVEQSEAFKKLQEGLKNGTFINQRGIIQTTLKVDQRYTSYLLNPKELWARSYAQYIAKKSGNATMLAQLDSVRNSDPFYGSRQWQDADFEAIAEAISTLFKDKGWQ